MDGYHKKVTVYWNITDKSTLFSPTQHVMTVLELPEDPDYSFKKSIDASVNEVVNVAKLLLTATDEVRKLILNECDMVLQCKVCKNLFSSVDNFLTHKRIYCQEEFADQTLLHRVS
ncbi:zinc finger protein 800-like [Scylla paramamosain]|uniref:zinc finger protein 800-like n=1 Tax=Scylla paramamosain TaxID=85552 RepID=UPI0030832BE6